MTNYSLDAIYILNSYLWDSLVNLEIIDPDNYFSDNLNSKVVVPILPVQQAPEFNQLLNGKTHIIYDKINTTYDTNWMMCDEQFLYTIYAISYSEINQIRNVFLDLFRRYDGSAKDVQDWIYPAGNFKFHSISVADISPTTPSDEIKGFFSTDITLNIKYSRITDELGRFA